MICDCQDINKTWFPKGNQRIVPIYRKHYGSKLLGTLNNETSEVFVEEHDKNDA
jgi:hypothetical protein